MCKYCGLTFANPQAVGQHCVDAHPAQVRNFLGQVEKTTKIRHTIKWLDGKVASQTNPEAADASQVQEPTAQEEVDQLNPATVDQDQEPLQEEEADEENLQPAEATETTERVTRTSLRHRKNFIQGLLRKHGIFSECFLRLKKVEDLTEADISREMSRRSDDGFTSSFSPLRPPTRRKKKRKGKKSRRVEELRLQEPETSESESSLRGVKRSDKDKKAKRLKSKSKHSFYKQTKWHYPAKGSKEEKARKDKAIREQVKKQLKKRTLQQREERKRLLEEAKLEAVAGNTEKLEMLKRQREEEASSGLTQAETERLGALARSPEELEKLKSAVLKKKLQPDASTSSSDSPTANPDGSGSSSGGSGQPFPGSGNVTALNIPSAEEEEAAREAEQEDQLTKKIMKQAQEEIRRIDAGIQEELLDEEVSSIADSQLSEEIAVPSTQSRPETGPQDELEPAAAIDAAEENPAVVPGTAKKPQKMFKMTIHVFDCPENCGAFFEYMNDMQYHMANEHQGRQLDPGWMESAEPQDQVLTVTERERDQIMCEEMEEDEYIEVMRRHYGQRLSDSSG